MKIVKNFIYLLMFFTLLQAENNRTYQELNLLVENSTDYKIAEDIKKITQSKMNLVVHYDTHIGQINKWATLFFFARLRSGWRGPFLMSGPASLRFPRIVRIDPGTSPSEKTSLSPPPPPAGSFFNEETD